MLAFPPGALSVSIEISSMVLVEERQKSSGVAIIPLKGAE